ncbi:hypothetical protein EZ313_11675 [Ramlibacter henchirensis]|uniref:Tail specific protease domain-containing protein n=1 Tax=Ramlibacter henchirensis TaxID=204072 RepID=A0A4Z0CA03_9BURK|nr:S41 family peptidase [Ramlibacter henchirensis]TFZ07230.1 hypothetical protein EZ313_11675 [Ramlibacter henchirensis]
MSHLAALRRAAVTTASLFLLACGGGGGSSTDTATALVSAGLFPESSSLAGQCTLDGQKRWLRSYMYEAYLWADEIQEVNAQEHGTVPGYFDALLVRTPDASGRARDRFSLTMTSSAADVMQNVGGAASAAAMASSANPVPLVKALTSNGGRKVGYVLFNEHSRGAQDALITAFNQLRANAVQDLVLDLRYNSGGFIYVAQTAASMVAGDWVDGQLFESVRFNDRRAREMSETFLFSTRVQRPESVYGLDHPLPQLSLPRLYVLTSQLTCSASESIINALRGIGVQVILVGDRTCGKPYGFYRMDNCGQAYFPIEFQVYNAAGFGDYQDGFPVQCRVAENPRMALGSATEPLLAAALNHIDTGSCPGGAATPYTASALQQSGGASMLDRPEAPAADSPMYQPGWNGRRLQP